MKIKSLLIKIPLINVIFFGISFSVLSNDHQLPDPDGKSADMTKPVQVYILMGQSNMLNFGKIKGDKEGTLENAVKNKKLYPYLIDEEGIWTTR